ncbi:RDD family protein [Micromonospora orduensis]|uniref:RDD family protein n=1 Tax=Micromonospora orduensis TaxID=1420891 RepID=A0A5C4QYB7_9ACTN|nr:RDD family protein [Micromonospora orduensis]TNH31039.1 RDD family protein [Micromonospora orduensis]
MTQPPSYPTPPAGGPQPAAGGFTPPPGPHPQGYAVPPQYAPPGYAVPPRYAPPPPALSPAGQPLASFGDRLLAWLIDTALASVVVMVLFMPVFLVLWWRMFSEMTRTNADGTLVEPDPGTFFATFFLPLLLFQAGLFVVLLGLYWLYHVEYLKRGGQTLGKKLMKLRVVPLDPSGTLDRRMAGRRWLVQHLACSLVPGASYADGLWQLWDKPWQQCLHDKFAGTVVVKVAS